MNDLEILNRCILGEFFLLVYVGQVLANRPLGSTEGANVMLLCQCRVIGNNAKQFTT